jgi:6,7-dimethyl-8-ribityllumazine synthase
VAEPGRFLEELGDEERAKLGAALQFAICVGSFYEDLGHRLLRGARDGFELAGVRDEQISELPVPGAFELPFAAKRFIDRAWRRYKHVEGYGYPGGVACLGVVIRGETDHYDFVCAETARGIQQVQLDTGVPCAFGVITCDTMEQALERAGGGKRDQGRNAALTVARMALLNLELHDFR